MVFLGTAVGRTQCRLLQRKSGSKEPRHLGKGLWQPTSAPRTGTLRSDQEIRSRILRKKLRGPMPRSYSLVLGLEAPHADDSAPVYLAGETPPDPAVRVNFLLGIALLISGIGCIDFTRSSSRRMLFSGLGIALAAWGFEHLKHAERLAFQRRNATICWLAVPVAIAVALLVLAHR